MNYYGIAIMVLTVFIVAPYTASAATITLEPQERDVGTHSAFLVGVSLDALEPVNVISITLTFSPGLEPVDISDGNSIINFWIDKPIFSQHDHTLTFSGLVPGGYSGVKGRLLTLSVQAHEEGTSTISISNISHIYLHGPTVEEDVINSLPLSLHVDSAKNNLSNSLPDTVPPESFTPTVAQLPTSGGSVPWMLLFTTQDKSSGIDHYEVHEADSFIPWWSSGWHVAQSPYFLEDQTLGSRLVIRAYDKNGNSREESLTAVHPSPLLAPLSIGVILTVILSIVFAMIFLKRRT